MNKLSLGHSILVAVRMTRLYIPHKIILPILGLNLQNLYVTNKMMSANFTSELGNTKVRDCLKRDMQ
jgi:hypothetical protein